MNGSDQIALSARAASRASKRPDYVGWVLERYADAEGANDQYFCSTLGISSVDLQRLRLCLRPRRQFFISDVEQIAIRFDLDAGELARIIRHVEAMEAMKQDIGGQSLEDIGLLLAARARAESKKSRRKGNDRGKRKKP